MSQHVALLLNLGLLKKLSAGFGGGGNCPFAPLASYGPDILLVLSPLFKLKKDCLFTLKTSQFEAPDEI